MPSKSSKTKKRATTRSPKKPARGSSEPRPSRVDETGLAALAARVAAELKSGDRVLIEGPMGAGKSTFARLLMAALGAPAGAGGSPTYPIAHEVKGACFPLIHVDFYRLRSEAEIEEAGIEAYFWERPEAVVLAEWISLFEGFGRAVRAPDRSGRTRLWDLVLDFDSEGDPAFRLATLRPPTSL